MAANGTRFIDIAVTYTADQFQGIHRGKKHHEEDFAQVLSRAAAVECNKIVLTTMTLEGARQNIAVCRRFPGRCYMTLGVHPYHVQDLYTGSDQIEELKAIVRSLLEHEKFLVAFGEIGLDYFYLDRADKQLQQKAFVEQLEVATGFDLPLFLHVRDSYEDFVTLIKPFLPRLARGGIVHSFAGTKEEMLGLVELGFDISVNGVSFTTAEQIDMVKHIPLDRLQLETDAPWCSIPKKGPVLEFLHDAPSIPPAKKPKEFVLGKMVQDRNESCTIARVSHVVAAIKELPLQQIIDAALRNSSRMFNIPIDQI